MTTIPHRVSPQEQLWGLTTELQHEIIRDMLRHLKKPDQEDICYALISYIKWRIKRPFSSPFMQIICTSLLSLVEGNNNHSINQKN